MQQRRMVEPKIDVAEYGVSVPLPEKEEDAPGKLTFLMSLPAKPRLVALLGRCCDDAFS